MRYLLLVLLAGLLVGCGASAAPAQLQTIDGLTIALNAPPEPELLDAAEFVVTLTRDGQPVDDADVYLDLTMPAMPMGANQPIAVGEGQGRYRANSVFDMAGDWQITVHATVDGQEYAATFEAMVAE